MLIGQLYQLPVIDFNMEAFEINLSDWSREVSDTLSGTRSVSSEHLQLSGATSFGIKMQYWNLMNSHWEPLIDPWRMSLQVCIEKYSHYYQRDFGLQIADQSQANLGKVITLSSPERLDINFTSAFVELALTTASLWPSQGEKALPYDRIERAPYRIRNCTGSTIIVWHDRDSNHRGPHESAVRLDNDRIIDWRFEDNKSLREVRLLEDILALFRLNAFLSI